MYGVEVQSSAYTGTVAGGNGLAWIFQSDTTAWGMDVCQHQWCISGVGETEFEILLTVVFVYCSKFHTGSLKCNCRNKIIFLPKFKSPCTAAINVIRNMIKKDTRLVIIFILSHSNTIICFSEIKRNLSIVCFKSHSITQFIWTESIKYKQRYLKYFNYENFWKIW